MDTDNYKRRVNMLCPTCGSDQFSYDDEVENSPVTCANCGREMTRDELIRENSENIELQISDMGKEVVTDLSKILNQSMRKAFRGNKKVRVK